MPEQLKQGNVCRHGSRGVGAAREKTLMRSVETQQRIRQPALPAFQERGLDADTMREIAAEARVATGAAYEYFPSKEAIVMDFV